MSDEKKPDHLRLFCHGKIDAATDADIVALVLYLMDEPTQPRPPKRGNGGENRRNDQGSQRLG